MTTSHMENQMNWAQAQYVRWWEQKTTKQERHQ